MKKSVQISLISIIFGGLIFVGAGCASPANETVQKSDVAVVPSQEQSAEEPSDEYARDLLRSGDEDYREDAEANDSLIMCHEVFEGGDVSFEYPCDWKNVVQPTKEASSTAYMESSDGSMKFYYPAPDFGLHGMEMVEQSFVQVNGSNYPTRVFEGSGQRVVFVDLGSAVSENEYGIMMSHKIGDRGSMLYRMLSTFSF